MKFGVLCLPRVLVLHELKHPEVAGRSWDMSNKFGQRALDMEWETQAITA